ncbi:MAG TPA: transposase [Pseudobdellovibrionaceae bacterium]|nr:transposase [Pseudobdellovibrionaceae bacterium]
MQSEFPYNISARCINREWFHVPMPKVWDIFCEELKRVGLENRLVIHSFILMSNHFHLIASTPEANISQCMHLFMGRTSRRLTREGNRINETFAGRHYKCLLTKPNHFLNAYKYNYRNPVTAGICERVEDYPFSTLRFVMKKAEPRFSLCEDATYVEDPLGTLRWLNTTPQPEKLEGVRYALKRPIFRSKKDRSRGTFLIGDEERL